MNIDRFELRDQGDGILRFQGHAVVFGAKYEIGPWTEEVRKGAFTRTLGEDPDVTLLLSHGGLPLARTKPNRTLRLGQDEIGLAVEADLDAHDPEVQSIARKYARGDLDGQMSFSFIATQDSFNDDYSHRVITGCSIHRGDVSIVVQGASSTTSSGFRSFTLEQRRKRAGEVGKRMTGGRITLMGDHVGEVPAASVATRARVAVPDYTSVARQWLDFELARTGHTLRRPTKGDFLAEARCDYDRMLVDEPRH
jgi:HK97 family phage prohead protease